MYYNVIKNNWNKWQLFIKPFDTKIVWKLGSTLHYINMLQPVYFKLFLHGTFLQCKYIKRLYTVYRINPDLFFDEFNNFFNKFKPVEFLTIFFNNPVNLFSILLSNRPGHNKVTSNCGIHKENYCLKKILQNI